MGPVVIVTNCLEGARLFEEKHPSEHSKRECVLLQVEADLLLLGVFSWSNIFGICPRDLECLGGLGGGTCRTSGFDSLLPFSTADSLKKKLTNCENQLLVPESSNRQFECLEGFNLAILTSKLGDNLWGSDL